MDVKYIVTADTKKATSEIGKVDKSIDGMKQQAQKSVGPLKGMFKQLAVGLVSVVAIRAAFRTLVGFVGDVTRAAMAQEEAISQLEARLKSTKGAAGLTKDELLKLASGLQEVTTYGDEAVIGAESLLLTFTNIGEKVFPDALETVLDMSTALGQDLKSSAVQLGKALNDPIEGVTALKRVGVSFTDAQRDQIAVLVESGRTLDAQKLILQELQVEFGGASRAAADTFGGSLKQLSNYWGDLKESIGTAITENEAIKQLIVDLKDQIIILIESGKIEEWANIASAAITGLAGGMRELLAIMTEFKPVSTQMAEGLSEFTMGLMGVEGPQTKMNRLQKEAIQKAIDFKDSLKVLSPKMEEIRERFEKGKEHAKAWMEEVREADKKAAAFNETIKIFNKWWKETNRLWEDAHPIIKMTTELIETGVHPALKNLVNILEIMKNVQPVLKDTFEEALPPAREFANVVLNSAVPALDSARLVSETATGEIRLQWDDIVGRFRTEYALGIVDAIGGAFDDLLTEGSDFSDAIDVLFDGLVENARTAFINMVEEFLANNVFKIMADAATSAVSSITSTLSGLTGSAAAGIGGGANAAASLAGAGGGAGGLWVGVGAAVGTFLGNLVTGGGAGFQPHDSGNLKLLMENSTALYPILGKLQDIHNTDIHIGNWTESIAPRIKITNNLLSDIRDNLKSMPSGQRGLDFYSGSQGGFARYHPGERITVTPSVHLNQPQHFETIVLEKNDKYIIQTVQKNLNRNNIRIPESTIKKGR